MNTLSRVLPLIILFLLTIAAIPYQTQAQCFSSLPMLGGINGMTGNPFQADVKRTFLGDQKEALERLSESRPAQVARDTQGRVRTEWISGKYKVQNGADAGAEVEQHYVNICDPVSGQSISLDTLTKTATVHKGPILGARAAALSKGVILPSFCSQQLRVPPISPDAEGQDLGHRTIGGVDAVGTLQKYSQSLQRGASVKQTTRDTELWCSEELGAVVLRSLGTAENGMTQIIEMTNIQRGEPDPLLFRIPPDYRIVERVNEPGVHQGLVFSQGFGAASPAPAESTVPAPKP